MKRLTKVLIASGCVAAIAGGVFVWADLAEVGWYLKHAPFFRRFFRPTVAGAVAAYGRGARARMAPKFEAVHASYPPAKLVLVAIKGTKELQVYSATKASPYQYVCTYPILGASGHLGPKLREGDYQVPEGIYQLTLEPDTPYHVALRLNYPNEIDWARARADGRSNPGSDILVHGTTGSVGCLAMGDEASEDLFVLANDTAEHPVSLIIVPVDLRSQMALPAQSEDPVWLPQLYKELTAALIPLPAPGAIPTKNLPVP
ncbi:MAG TPA: hypothetical protein V6C97_32875 [Oculatellaceae cyanobacterium]